MTMEEIKERREKASCKFAIAIELRAILDKHRAAYGADDWDADDMDEEIGGLVFDDE